MARDPDGTTSLPSELQTFFLVTLGMKWPEGDEGGLKDIGRAWSAFADALEIAVDDAARAAGGIGRSMHGMTADRTTEYLNGELADDLTKMIDGARELAKAARNAAADIQKTKIMLIIMGLLALATIIELLYTLIFSWMIPAVKLAAQIGLQAILKKLVAKLAAVTFAEAGKTALRVGGKVAQYAAIGAGFMVTLDFSIQAGQVIEGKVEGNGEGRDGFDGKSIGNSAIGGAIGGGMFGLFRGLAKGAGQSAIKGIAKDILKTKPPIRDVAKDLTKDIFSKSGNKNPTPEEFEKQFEKQLDRVVNNLPKKEIDDQIAEVMKRVPGYLQAGGHLAYALGQVGMVMASAPLIHLATGAEGAIWLGILSALGSHHSSTIGKYFGGDAIKSKFEGLGLGGKPDDLLVIPSSLTGIGRAPDPALEEGPAVAEGPGREVSGSDSGLLGKVFDLSGDGTFALSGEGAFDFSSDGTIIVSGDGIPGSQLGADGVPVTESGIPGQAGNESSFTPGDSKSVTNDGSSTVVPGETQGAPTALGGPAAPLAAATGPGAPGAVRQDGAAQPNQAGTSTPPPAASTAAQPLRTQSQAPDGVDTSNAGKGHQPVVEASGPPPQSYPVERGLAGDQQGPAEPGSVVRQEGPAEPGSVVRQEGPADSGFAGRQQSPAESGPVVQQSPDIPLDVNKALPELPVEVNRGLSDAPVAVRAEPVVPQANQGGGRPEARPAPIVSADQTPSPTPVSHTPGGDRPAVSAGPRAGSGLASDVSVPRSGDVPVTESRSAPLSDVNKPLPTDKRLPEPANVGPVTESRSAPLGDVHKPLPTDKPLPPAPAPVVRTESGQAPPNPRAADTAPSPEQSRPSTSSQPGADSTRSTVDKARQDKPDPALDPDLLSDPDFRSDAAIAIAFLQGHGPDGAPAPIRADGANTTSGRTPVSFASPDDVARSARRDTAVSTSVMDARLDPDTGGLAGGGKGQGKITWIRYDVSRFQTSSGDWVRQFRVPIDLVSSELGGGAVMLERAAEIQAVLDKRVNSKYRFGNGDQAHFILDAKIPDPDVVTEGWEWGGSKSVPVELFDSAEDPWGPGSGQLRWDFHDSAADSARDFVRFFGLGGGETPVLRLTAADLAMLDEVSRGGEGVTAGGPTDGARSAGDGPEAAEGSRPDVVSDGPDVLPAEPLPAHAALGSVEVAGTVWDLDSKGWYIAQGDGLITVATTGIRKWMRAIVGRPGQVEVTLPAGTKAVIDGGELQHVVLPGEVIRAERPSSPPPRPRPLSPQPTAYQEWLGYTPRREDPSGTAGDGQGRDQPVAGPRPALTSADWDLV